MSRPMAGVLALLANIVVTALVLVVIKKKLSPEDLEAQKEIEEEDIDLNDIQIS